MLNVEQFKNEIIIPTLKATGLDSEAAVELLIGTALIESRLTYLVQAESGPALGVYQMEPATLRDIYWRYLQRPDKKNLLIQIQEFKSEASLQLQLVHNLAFATLMARVRYFMVPEALPNAKDIDGLASYWKRHYNTMKGKGKARDFVGLYNAYLKELEG